MAARRRNQPSQKIVDHSRIVVGVEDMVLLPDVRDTGIAENLRSRLRASEMYTYIGAVLIACNPYKWLNIYDETFVKQYILRQRTDVPPHIFATAELAYRGMLQEEESQCIIISGESGAGKTEASKQIQNYIASVSGGGEGVDKIKEVFLRSNPVLEAFGNAKTLRNNNSSRFGKYFELKFNRFGSPMGGIITNYLLEKSRIVRPGEGERGFHIFYQLLSSSYARGFQLTDAGSFNYLSCSHCTTVDGIDDTREFEDTLAAMRSVGLANGQIQSVLNVVAAVLHLGNVTFQPKQVESAEGCQIAKKDPLSKFCELAKIDGNALAQVLTFRELQTMAAGGKMDTYQVPQNPIQAAARRDALAKSLYERLFDLIVTRINAALDPDRLAASQADGEDAEDMLSIGVLDIYGFEVFENNAFEQLCINYVNEKLQQIFIELTLRAEQDEYEREGIAWEAIPFFNNKIVCELLDSARPAGVFRILDDTCKTMHGTRDGMDVDKKFLETCAQVHGSHKHFFQNTRVFTIKHYAGDVSYTVGKFGEANKDALNKDMILLMKTTSDKLINLLFGEEVDMDDKKAAPTAGNRIRTQCQALVTALMECSPHYVRCIKSNDQKQALTMDIRRVEHQVKYLGLAENIKVRRAGFAYRTEYSRFLDRFAIMSVATYPDWKGSDKDGCKEIIKSIATRMDGITKDEVQLGRSMIFVRKPETYFGIEKLRERCIGDYAVKIQRCWRKHSAAREFVKLQMFMGKIYSEKAKTRRRDSIFRPYGGDYLDCLGNCAETIRDGIFRIIDHYDGTENIVFADINCWQIVKDRVAPFLQVPRLIVLTNAALYIMETPINAEAKTSIHPTKSIPNVLLRRRIVLDANAVNTASIESVSVSLLADPCLVLHCKPTQRLAAPITSHYIDNAKADKCMQTGQPFSMFTWRHHCRVSGFAFVDAVCNFLEPVPDLGFYTPNRVNDQYIGLSSTEEAEDILLICDKKSELLGLLMNNVKTIRGSSINVTFGNSVRLRSGPDAALSRVPAAEIVFVQGQSTPRAVATTGKPKRPGNAARSQPHAAGATAAIPTTLPIILLNTEFKADISSDRNRLTVATEPGLPQDVVEERRKRQAARQKRAEVKRKKAEEERRVRSAAREKEREKERLIRLAEKKARKKAEKEAKRRARELSNGITPASGAAKSSKARPAASAPAPPPLVVPGFAGGRGGGRGIVRPSSRNTDDEDSPSPVPITSVSGRGGGRGMIRPPSRNTEEEEAAPVPRQPRPPPPPQQDPTPAPIPAPPPFKPAPPPMRPGMNKPSPREQETSVATPSATPTAGVSGKSAGSASSRSAGSASGKGGRGTGPGPNAGPSSAASELAAAMARRRAANNEA